jgi:hypothetical protein
MNPQDYRPSYDTGVYEWLPADPMGRDPVNINPAYCLMGSSALVLASFFVPVPKIVLLPPTTQAAGSPFAFNRNVPWFDFGNGVLRNAGVLAGYWGMPGVPFDQALYYAKLDVATVVEGQ